MATFTVNTTADVVDGNYSLLSLRESVNRANSTIAGDTIVFAGSLEGQTLVLTSGELTLSQDVTIDGDQNSDGIEVALSGGDSSRILRSSGSGTDLALQDLTLTDGRVGSGAQGGGVLVGGGGSLALADCTIRDCRSGVYDAPAGNGGGIFAEGGSRVIVAGSRVEGNYASASGGGIAATEGNVALVVRDSHFAGNIARGYGLSGGAIHVGGNSSLVIEDSSLAGNHAYLGGALAIYGSTATIARSTISGNSAHYVGGILTSSSSVTLNDSTIVGNSGSGYFGGIEADGGELVVRNATITGNDSQSGDGQGGGIVVSPSTRLDIANSIIAGNSASPYQSGVVDPDISGAITASNGHNIFGSDVAGNNPADRENIAASAIFANIDPATGGGQINAVGIVPLLNSINNPALSGADPLAAGATGQTGDSSRPLPAGSLPDIGSIEITHALSTTNSARNDVITGTAAVNTLNGDLGNDYLKGLGGKDTLNGGNGSDLLDGGTANDKLNGGGGIDLVFFGGATKVTFDLAATTDTAKRGSETDTLTGVEGAIGSSAADDFKGNEFNNYFQGGLGKDTYSGGSGRDLYDINATAESGVGSTLRDIIADFDHLVDDIDLMGIDANTAVSGNQAFRWLGATPLSGAGQVGFFTSSGNTFIRGSNDADAASEFEIQLNGIKTLSADDFYL